MLCTSPFVRDPTGKIFKASLLTGERELALSGIPFPCGQCLACRINRRRLWTHRLLLESYLHQDSCFITLTYADEYIPEGASLSKRHLQLFLKRLRKACGTQRLRYYAVGEYGTRTHRPHYHAIVYGLSLLDGEKVARAWPYGLVHVAECNQHTIQYVAGYVTKKFVKRDDPRLREFSTMSRKPGLGYGALDQLVTLCKDERYAHLFEWCEDIPDGLRHGSKLMPFDRYLRDKLRLMLEKDPDSTEYIREMHLKYIQAKDQYQDNFLERALIDESDQRNVQIERRFKIYNRRDSI